MLTSLQKKTCQAIIQLFETSKLDGSDAYSQVTLLQGDTGGLTYGKHQTTLMSGNLYLLIQDYVDNDGVVAHKFRPFLDRMARCDADLNKNSELKALLREAGKDPKMVRVQDEFFDRVYWEPSFQAAKALNLTMPLSFAVVYDGNIHGSFKRIRDLTLKSVPKPSTAMASGVEKEKLWVETYLTLRRNWLKTHSNVLLRKTVYRQDAFFQLIKDKQWGLDLPFTVRGVMITADKLGEKRMTLPTLDANDPPACSAKDGSDVKRLLRLLNPPMIGVDVKEVQTVLMLKGYPLIDDSVFGPTTFNCVQMFQRANGLKDDGIVGNATRCALGLS